MVKSKLNNDQFEISNAKKWTNSNSGKTVYFFNLKINLENDNYVILNSCKVVENKKGEYFIAPSSILGENGKYYNNAFIKFDEKTQDKIIENVILSAR